jgi:hypothetical protein
MSPVPKLKTFAVGDKWCLKAYYVPVCTTVLYFPDKCGRLMQQRFLQPMDIFFPELGWGGSEISTPILIYSNNSTARLRYVVKNIKES